MAVKGLDWRWRRKLEEDEMEAVQRDFSSKTVDLLASREVIFPPIPLRKMELWKGVYAVQLCWRMRKHH